MHFVGQRGEILFYRSSGALWVHDSQADAGYVDERRPWRAIETRDPVVRDAQVAGDRRGGVAGLAGQANGLSPELRAVRWLSSWHLDSLCGA